MGEIIDFATRRQLRGVYDTTGGARRLVITANEWGFFYVEALANGEPFRFLIDTGAWSIVFGRQHAQRLGFNPDRLCYDRLTRTANGTGRAADFPLRELRIGDFVLCDEAAHISSRDMPSPFLGMSVLKLLHVEFHGGQCILTLPEPPQPELEWRQHPPREYPQAEAQKAGLSPAPGVWLRQLNETEQNLLTLLVMGTVGIPASVMFGVGVMWILGLLLQLAGVV